MRSYRQHVSIDGLSFGALDDEESDSQALGDGADEDGTLFGSNLQMRPGNTATLSLYVSNTTGKTAYLEAWIDWNGDGDLNAPGKKILTLHDSTSGFPSSYTVTVPNDAILDQDIGVRFRLSHENNKTPLGTVESGEVEDYMIRISCETQVCLPINITKN